MQALPSAAARRRPLQSPEIQPSLLRLHSSVDIEQFWEALQALLGAATPHDALITYLNFFDFTSSWRAAKILATPNAARPLNWFEARRQVDMTPQFVLSRPQKIKLYRLSDVIPDPAELRRTEFFQNYLAPNGWHHLGVMLFWRGGAVCSQVALRRTERQGDFSSEEVRLLEDLHPHIETVLNRLISHEEEKARRRWLEAFNDHLPFGLLFLNLELETIYINREGLEQCAAWNFGPQQAHAYHARDVFRVPDEVITACSELKGRWLNEQAPAASRTGLRVRLSHPEYAGLTANISLQADAPCPAAKPGFFIHLARSADAGDRTPSLPIHSMLANLTDAEREIARLVLSGKSNKEVAAVLKKSVYTVKSQLTRIYRKVGVPSRSRFLALVK